MNMTLEKVRAEMMEREGKYRYWINAIDAHLAKAGEPVAWQFRNIFPGEVGTWRDVDKKFAEDPKHESDPSIEIRRLYAAPPSADHAQPSVADGDRANLIDSVRSLRDRWMATTRHDGHDGDFDTLLEVIDRLKRDAAIAQPAQPVEAAAELYVKCKRCAGEGMTDVYVGSTGGSFMQPPDPVFERDACPECYGACFVAHPRPMAPDGYELVWAPDLAALRERDYVFHDADRGGHLWYWQGDGQDVPESLSCPVVMSADTLRTMIAKSSAPTVEQAGEVVTGEAVAEIIRGTGNEFSVSWLIEGGIDALIEGETLYILGMNCPDDGAVELYAQPRPVGVPDARYIAIGNAASYEVHRAANLLEKSPSMHESEAHTFRVAVAYLREYGNTLAAAPAPAKAGEA